MQADEQGDEDREGRQPGRSVLSTTTDNPGASLPGGSGTGVGCQVSPHLKSGSRRIYHQLPLVGWLRAVLTPG